MIASPVCDQVAPQISPGQRVVARLGAIPYSIQAFDAILGSDLKVSGNRFFIVGARVERTGDGLIAYPSLRQESGRLSSIGGINGLIMVEGGTRTITEGSRVVVELTDS